MTPVGLPIQAIPNGPDIDLNGHYVGRIVGYNNQTVLVDIQIEVNGYEVTATLSNRGDRKTYRATGTRSVFPGSPVPVNLLSTSGQGSVCEGGFTEWGGVNRECHLPGRQCQQRRGWPG